MQTFDSMKQIETKKPKPFITTKALLSLWLIIFSSVYSQSIFALKFDTNEPIILKGESEKLAENEGYLYLSIDSQVLIKYLTIWHVDGGKQVRFDNVSTGEHQSLIKLKAGDYYWSRFKVGNYFYDFNRKQFPFTVKSGVINYPGTWRFDFSSKNNIGTLYISSKNGYTSALENFRKNHSHLLKDQQFLFQGEFKDHFAQHYNSVSTDHPQNANQSLFDNVTFIEHDKNDNIETEKTTFANIEEYFKENNQSIGKINPNGHFLFYTNTIEEYTTINVLNLTTYESFTIYKEKIPKHSYIETIKWIDEDSIFYSIHSPKGDLNLVVHLSINNRLEITGTNHLVIPYHGELVAPLNHEDNVIYFGNSINYNKKRRGLYKVDTSTKKTIKKSLKKHYSSLKKLKGSIYWLTDHNSEIRFVITDYDGSIDYWFLPQEHKPKWKKIKSFQSYDDLIVPDMLSTDGRSFYVVTDKFTDKNSIQEYSTNDFSHKGSIYEDNNINVESLISDPSTGELIGVRYLENGYFKFNYFQTDKDSLNELRKNNPNLQLFSVQNNVSANTILIYGINEYTKGSWYLYKTDTQKIFKLFSQDAEYDQLAKGTFTPVNIKSVDDLDIEGYLVTPNDMKTNQKSPLIVIPHGGPIGVRDYAYETDIQHFYASQGFATLKINYRGSGGFGKKFKESGNLQWGGKIESDINNMVDHVINNYAIDENSICSMGSSYGGYSAIMLTALFPKRYKCAVSFAGVTDISLMFSSSDFRYNEKVMESFSEIVGDPKKDLQKIIDKSPVYLTDQLPSPIMLFHGEKDRRVTIEHSLRMKAMMDIKNQPIDMIVFKDEGHSFTHKETKIIYIARALQFIKKQLFNNSDH